MSPVASIDELMRAVHDALAGGIPIAPAGRAPRPATAAVAGLRARPLAEVLHDRASCRDFAERPVEWDQLRGLVDTAMRADSGVWLSDREETSPLFLGILAQRVANGDDGTFVIRRGQAAARVGLLTSKRAALSLVPSQPSFASAPAVLIALGDVVASCSKAPTIGYFELLLRAGAALHAAWMAAVADGLAAGMFAGINVAAARRMFDLERLEIPLLALPVGYPAGRAMPRGPSRGSGSGAGSPACPRRPLDPDA